MEGCKGCVCNSFTRHTSAASRPLTAQDMRCRDVIGMFALCIVYRESCQRPSPPWPDARAWPSEATRPLAAAAAAGQLVYPPLPTTDGSSLAACSPPKTEPETPVDRREIPGLHLVTGSGAYLAPVMMPDEPPKAGLMPSLPEKVWMPDLSMAELLMTFLVSRSISPICSCYHSDAGSNVSDLPDPLTPAHNGHPPSTSKLPRTGMAR